MKEETIEESLWRDTAIRAEAALITLRREHAALFRDVLPHLTDMDLRSRVAYGMTSISRYDAGAGLLAELRGLQDDLTKYMEDAQRMEAALRDVAALEHAEGDAYERLCDAVFIANETLQGER